MLSNVEPQTSSASQSKNTIPLEDCRLNHCFANSFERRKKKLLFFLVFGFPYNSVKCDKRPIWVGKDVIKGRLLILLQAFFRNVRVTTYNPTIWKESSQVSQSADGQVIGCDCNSEHSWIGTGTPAHTTEKKRKWVFTHNNYRTLRHETKQCRRIVVVQKLSIWANNQK